MTATSAPSLTSAPRAARRPRVPVWQLGVAAAAVPLGVAAAFQPALALAGVLAVALLPVVLTRPIVGLSAVVLFGFLESFAAVTGAVSVTKIVGVLLALAWLGIVATATS